MCLHFVVITATIGLILMLLVLYEVMLLVQVHIETGVRRDQFCHCSHRSDCQC